MMENRSFDHMLGYPHDRAGPRPTSTGLTHGDVKNAYRGKTYHVHPAARTTLTKDAGPVPFELARDDEQIS